MKKAMIATLVAVLAAGIAWADEPKKDEKASCVPPPKDLVVKELSPGSGTKTIKFKSGVWMSYTGWVYDPCAPHHRGLKFDSSEGRQTPFGFLVGTGRVIKGWDEGVMGMKEHAKRLLVIPPDKAYGAAGSPDGKVPPNATLVFEVEVIGIPFEPPPEVAPQPAAPKQ